MRRTVSRALVALALAWAPAATAQIRISNLPAAAALTGTEVAPVVQGGVTTRASVNQIVARASSVMLAAPNTWTATQSFTAAMLQAPILVGFGGSTSSFPALKALGSLLQVRLADDSGDANLSAGSIIATGVVKTIPYTVATLPSAVTNGAGSRSFVTDASSFVFNSILAGGGTNAVPVFSDGVTWRIG